MGRRRLRDVARRSGRVPWRGPRPRCRPRRCGLPRPSGGDAYRRLGTGGCRILSVEPDTAAGILASLQSGEPTSVPTADPIMAGLNCGTVSAAAWPVLRRGLDAAISVHDDEARTAVTDLATEGVSARPSAGMAPPPAPASRDRLHRDRDRGLSRRHPRRPRLRRGARPGRDRARRVVAPRRRHTQHRAARGYGRLADHQDARSGPRLAQPGRHACVRPRRAPGDGARCCGPAVQALLEKRIREISAGV